MPARKLNQDHLRRLHNQGLTTAQIADITGVSPFAVRSNRRALGLTPPPRQAATRRPQIDRDAVARLTDEGLTGRQIAQELGCTEGTIIRIRKELGISPGIRMTPERKARIQQMVNDGWSWKEIERTEGANYDTMRRHFPGTAWTHSHNSRLNATTRNIRPRLGTKKAA